MSQPASYANRKVYSLNDAIGEAKRHFGEMATTDPGHYAAFDHQAAMDALIGEGAIQWMAAPIHEIGSGDPAQDEGTFRSFVLTLIDAIEARHHDTNTGENI
jgi:hypothetical protein